MTFTKKESLEARRELKQILKDNGTQTVFVVQRHVSRSGMQRKLDLYILPSAKRIRNNTDYTKLMVFDEQIEPRNITSLVAKALQWPFDTKWGCITVNGCGMDMHFHTVYELAACLYNDVKVTKYGNQGYYLKHRTI